MIDKNSKFYYYANKKANKEVENKTYDAELWRKAIALMSGDELRAKEKYIKLRIIQLKRDGYQPEKSSEREDAEPSRKSTRKTKEELESNQDSFPHNIPEGKKSNKRQLWNKVNISKQWIMWIFFGLIGLIIIFVVILNVGSKSTEDISNVSYSERPDHTTVTVDEYVKDSDFERELRAYKKKEKERAKKIAKEAEMLAKEADIAEMKAILEMGEEE